MRLERISLRGARRSELPGVNTRSTYLVKYAGNLYLGKFTRQWYGLNFNCDFGASGMQFNAPGYNLSRWQGVWRVVQ